SSPGSSSSERRGRLLSDGGDGGEGGDGGDGASRRRGLDCPQDKAAKRHRNVSTALSRCLVRGGHSSIKGAPRRRSRTKESKPWMSCRSRGPRIRASRASPICPTRTCSIPGRAGLGRGGRCARGS